MVIIVDVTQAVLKGANYLNKILSVCRYKLVYSGNVYIIVGTIQENLWDLKAKIKSTYVLLILKSG